MNDTVTDAMLQRAVLQNEQGRRRRRLAKGLLFGFPFVVAAALFALNTRSNPMPPALEQVSLPAYAPDPGPALDGFIQTQEAKARTTNDPAAYDQLASALRKRLAAEPTDRDRAALAEATARADRWRGARAPANPVGASASLLLLVPGLMVSIALVWLGNRLLQADERCDASWAHIQTLSRSRADLLPGLAKVAADYAAHESDVMARVASLRQSAAPSAGDILAVVGHLEQIPAVKSDQHFLRLQEELSTTESLLSAARQRLERDVATYNTLVRTFPGSWLASLLRLPLRDYGVDAGVTPGVISQKDGTPS